MSDEKFPAINRLAPIETREGTKASYIIVAFLNEPKENFRASEWPQHVTIIRPFSTSQSTEELVQKIEEVASNHNALVLHGKARRLFGPLMNIRVTKMEDSPDLLSLYEDMQSALGSDIETIGKTFPFKAHITDNTGTPVPPGTEIPLRTISLVRIDGDNRSVLHTVPLRNQGVT